MNLWTYSLRETSRRPGRSLFTLLSIVLGVGTVFAVSTTVDGARLAYTRMTEALAGKADAQVTARGGGRFDQQAVAPLTQAPDVKVAVPLLHQQAVLNTGSMRLQINGIGTDLTKEKILHPFELVSGRLLEKDGEVVLEESLAKSAGIKAGDELKMLTRRGLQRITVVGLIRPTELWALTQGGLTYLGLEDWQYLCKADGKIDTLQIALVPGADRKRTLAALAQLLPAELQLRSAAEDQASSNVTLIAFQYGLEATRTLALIVAGLLILNTFLMNVTERRGQIAVLRLVGSTRRQIMGLLLREGALVGTLGALLGLPLGLLLARWLARATENAFTIRLENPELAWKPMLLSFAVGPVVAVLAAFWPAYRASQVGALETLRQRSSAQPTRRGRKRITLGVLLLVLSSAAMFLSWARILPQGFAITVTIFFLLSLLFLFPLVSRPAYGLAHRLLRFLGPMEGELALHQMVRTEGRALLTWGILFMAVTTSAATGLILTDVISDIRLDVRRTTRADFIVRVTTTNLATGMSASLPEDLTGQVNALPGIHSVERMTMIGMEIEGAGRVVAVVREFGLYERPPLVLPETHMQEVQHKVLAGEIVISDILAYKIKRQAGDLVTLEHSGKMVPFRIAATTPLFLAGGMALFMDRPAAERAFGAIGTDALFIDAVPSQRESVAERLREVCHEKGFLFQTYAEVQDRLQHILDTVVASLWVLLALGFLIAVFGVTNTLMMNILEQTREIGLMRVLGMQRRQIRRMVLAQSAYVGLVAIFPGMLTGVLLAYVIRGSSLAILGENPHFGAILPWLVPYGAGLLLLVLIFGWLPAARAARLNILESIRTE